MFLFHHKGTFHVYYFNPLIQVIIFEQLNKHVSESLPVLQKF